VAPEEREEREVAERGANGVRGRLEEIKGLLVRANAGDKEVMPELRWGLEEMPELARRFGNPAAHVERATIEGYAGEDLLAKESMSRNLALMREELAGEDPSPLERLLAERVVATWLQLQYFEHLHIRSIT
jgi:hypothetical protein